MAGLHLLKHTYSLPDEDVVKGWVENPYWQHFYGSYVKAKRFKRARKVLRNLKSMAGRVVRDMEGRWTARPSKCTRVFRPPLRLDRQLGEPKRMESCRQGAKRREAVGRPKRSTLARRPRRAQVLLQENPHVSNPTPTHPAP